MYATRVERQLSDLLLPDSWIPWQFTESGAGLSAAGCR